MRSSKLTVVLLVAIGLAVAINNMIRTPSTVDVRIIIPPTIIAALPHWVAEDQGYYEQEGISVHPIALTTSGLMVQALSSDNADVLPAVSLVDILNALPKSTDPPKIFSHSRMTSATPFDSVLVLRGGPLVNLRDLAGRQIAVYPGMTATEALREFLNSNRVDTSRIRFVQLPPPEHIAALDRGDVDAGFEYEPTRSQLLQSGRTRELTGSVYASFNDPSAIGVSAVSTSFLHDHPESAARFFRVWDRSIDFIRSEQRAREILAMRLGIAQDVANAATWVDATKLAEIDITTVRKTGEFFQKIGSVAPEVNLSDDFFVPVEK